MKADTYARLVVLETLVDAEIGHRLERGAECAGRWVETMVARISDLVDEIDVLDVLTAARTYDALVDFLADLPEADEALVEQTVRFKRAVDHIVARGMDPAALESPSTWAVVLDELLAALAAEYREQPLRARSLAYRARDAADRMVARAARERRGEVRSALDRLAFAVHARSLDPAAVEALAGAARALAARYRPAGLTRMGAYVLGQLLRRRPRAEPS